MRDVSVAAVHAHREKMGAGYALRVIEGRLRDLLGEAPEFAGVSVRSTDGARKPSLGSNPRGWLYGVVMGSIAIPLDEASTRVLSTAVADYLDPLIDGNVPAHKYDTWSDGLFIDRLHKARESASGAGDGVMDISADLVLACYVRHAVTKMNMNMGFDVHQPGVGRQPLPPSQLDEHYTVPLPSAPPPFRPPRRAAPRRAAPRHSRAASAAQLLGIKLAEAISRDFAPDHRRISSLEITPSLITEMGRAHMTACMWYQNELTNALACANRDGEEARKRERMRIWGYYS